ncbi:MAG: putative signal transducing protein [Panacagrimonas sp.]
MSCFYLAADPLEAEIVRGLLAAERIETDVRGSMLWAGRGELAADPYPRIVLRDPRDEARAREILREYQTYNAAQTTWACACGESVPGNFAVCWACGEASA